MMGLIQLNEFLEYLFWATMRLEQTLRAATDWQEHLQQMPRTYVNHFGSQIPI